MSAAYDSPLEVAKERIRIPDLWRELGLEGEPRKHCRCPFHEDRSPSFSIFDDGRVWKCHAGCGEGSVVDFLAKARGLSDADACQEILRRGDVIPQRSRSPRREVDAHNDKAEKARKRESWPTFETPTQDEIGAIADLRGLSVEGVSLAADRGLLFCADSREGRAWIVTDSGRINAQGRLLSGKPWSAGMKAKTLPGSEAASPIGLLEASSFPAIALVEGGPDILAAVHLAWCAGVEDRVAVIAMLGASNRIPEDVLPHFAGKRVRVFQHDDQAGRNAGALWAAQLIAAGVEVDGYSFAGLSRADRGAVKDLNDFAHVHPDLWEEQRNIIEEAFSFALGGPPEVSNGAANKTRVKGGIAGLWRGLSNIK